MYVYVFAYVQACTWYLWELETLDPPEVKIVRQL